LDEVAPARLSWEPDVRSAIAVSIMAAVALTMMTRESPFLYFQF
jgi:hypothetical protein